MESIELIWLLLIETFYRVIKEFNYFWNKFLIKFYRNLLIFFEKDSILNSKPWVEITITDKNKAIRTFKGFHRYNTAKEIDTSIPGSQYDSDRMYALVNGEKDFVLVQFFQMNPLIKPLDYFLKQQ